LSDAPKEEKKSVFRELGLPYVSDPAVTRHLAAFLGSSGVAPDAILFNGGFFIPDICRERVADVIERWYGKRPLVFENRDLDLAVSVGAAYYSYVRSTGAGLLVRGGLPRAYYIETAGDGAGAVRTLCLVPRGTEETSVLEIDTDSLQLVANKPVSFRLYSSLVRTEDQLGQVVEFTPEEIDTGALHLHAPLNAVIRFGKAGERLVPVKLGARLTEVGTLEIWAESKVSEHRWRLQFELRKTASAAAGAKAAAVIGEESVVAGEALIELTFGSGGMAPEELPAKLEQTLGLGRMSWPGSVIRRLADRMIERAESRKKSAAHELRWLNLCGFCLRPGFGFPGDDFRVEQVRRVYAGGLTFGNQVQNEIDWWIFWGRVAGGMNKNQQTDMFQRLSAFLLPRGAKKMQRINSSLLREMWRTAASLELLPVGTKTQLGDALAAMLKKGEMVETALWCLSRIGARKLFYGPTNLVVPAATATRWIEAVMKNERAEDAVRAMARRTGDSTRDLTPQSLDMVRSRFPQMDLEGEDAQDLQAMGRVFGEELPSGLILAAGATT
jgi:hypothetical protein